ncbi:hypothetical protein CLV51_10576 [Chitinophaga niastensis]|uniref:Uncharacterized protein n=1 Tax=Chitinophaga niastensis TaxID=536980 RepID=A0A2P8HEU6_CHINA|nr:hypothetical protein [Chitinophaga niastensis]PSL44704.1 hypothetical protein CLV51_10576 [Chitinophaga niastensis]
MQTNNVLTRKVLVITSTLLLLHSIVYSQVDKYMNNCIKAYDLVYNKPAGFVEVYPELPYFAGNRIVPNAYIYELQSEKSDITICISVMDLASINDSAIIKFDPMADRNANFIRKIRLYADTLHDQNFFFPEKYVKHTFHASDAAIYKLNNTTSYRNKYPFCKVLSIHKKDKTDIEISYFYNESSKPYIKQCIKQTQEMLTFKE